MLENTSTIIYSLNNCEESMIEPPSSLSSSYAQSQWNEHNDISEFVPKSNII